MEVPISYLLNDIWDRDDVILSSKNEFTIYQCLLDIHPIVAEGTCNLLPNFASGENLLYSLQLYSRFNNYTY